MVLREAGAKEVHLRITSPPVKWPCFYGIDTGDRGELIAAHFTINFMNLPTESPPFRL